jgi:SAM-dependent methyltransferase
LLAPAMQNKHLWKPSKFVVTAKGCRASKDSKQVARGSRFAVDILATAYEGAIKLHASGVLLDLGCGNVPLYEIYQSHVSDNICVDWEGTRHKSPFLDHSFDLNHGIPLPSETFDTILATDVLEHVSNPELLWREMARVLKPGGKIILGVPFFYWLHEEPHDYQRFTKYKLQMFCEQNGLTVVSLESCGGAPEIIFDIISKNIPIVVRNKTVSKILSACHFFAGNVFVQSNIGRKLSRASAQKFPLFYSLVAQKAAMTLAA